MNRNRKTWLPLLFCAAGICLFAGCSGEEETFTRKTYISEKGQVRAIQIHARDREIQVSPSQDEKVHVAYWESEKEGFSLSVAQEGTLVMVPDDNKEWQDYIGGKASAQYRSISLQVPDGLLSTLEISTTNESISLSELAVERGASLSANGGDIHFDKLDVGESLALEVKNGNITGTVAGSYDDFSITCQSKKGENNLPEQKDGGEKSLSVTSNNGDVTVQFS